MGNQRWNKRSRSERLDAERDALLGGERLPAGQPDEEWQTLNAQIGALEDFLSGAARREAARRRQKLQNILPPPDRAGIPSSAPRRMSRWQERHYLESRQRNGLNFLLLFAAVCALLWWLLHSAAGM